MKKYIHILSIAISIVSSLNILEGHASPIELREEVRLAIVANNLKKVNELLKQNTYPQLLDIPDEKGWTLLYNAVASNNVEIVSSLLLNNAQVNHQDKANLTPLEFAISLYQQQNNYTINIINTLLRKWQRNLEQGNQLGKEENFIHFIQCFNNSLKDSLLDRLTTEIDDKKLQQIQDQNYLLESILAVYLNKAYRELFSSICKGSTYIIKGLFSELFMCFFNPQEFITNKKILTPSKRLMHLLKDKELIMLSDLSDLLTGLGSEAPSTFHALYRLLTKQSYMEKIMKKAEEYFENKDKIQAIDLKATSLRIRKQALTQLKASPIHSEELPTSGLYCLVTDTDLQQPNRYYLWESWGKSDQEKQELSKQVADFNTKIYQSQDHYRTDLLRVQNITQGAMQGQKKVVAIESIRNGTILGIYTGIYLDGDPVNSDIQEELKWLSSQKGGGISKIHTYACDIPLYDKNNKQTGTILVSAYRRGNALAYINAYTTHGRLGTTRREENVKMCVARYNKGKVPFILFYASKDINDGQELLLDYEAAYWDTHIFDNQNINHPEANIWQDYIARCKAQKERSSRVGFLKFVRQYKSFKLFLNTGYADLAHSSNANPGLACNGSMDGITISIENSIEQIEASIQKHRKRSGSSGRSASEEEKKRSHKC